MPCKKSSCFNLTFRPKLVEFEKVKESFLSKLQSKLKKEKYIFSFEKGSSDVINHIQGFIELSKEKRADTFRKSINALIKDYDITYPKVALKITPVIRDVSVCQGYILKECKDLEKVSFQGYSLEYLLKVQKEYLTMTISKKVKVDKIRVNSRNFFIVFSNYVEANAEKIGKYGYDLKTTADIKVVIKRMVQDGYYCFDLLLNEKRFTNIAMNICLLYNDDLGDGKSRILDS